MSKIAKALVTPPIPFVILGTVAMQVGMVVGCEALLRAIGARTGDGGLTFVLGALVATSVLTLSAVVAVLAGGVNWLTGAAAERWTGKILDGLGPGWRVVHNVVFDGEAGGRAWQYDVDHVAVGRGGALVVESKYTTSDIDLDAPQLSTRIRNDAAQAARNATSIRRLFFEAGVDVPVAPLLVYWGYRLASPGAAITRIGRVHVVIGSDAKRWTHELPADRSGIVDVEKAIAALLRSADHGSGSERLLIADRRRSANGATTSEAS